MNYKALINDVREYLVAQGRVALNKDRDSCMYRTPDGLKCAVGCLWPDELYTPRMEGSRVTVLDTTVPDKWALFVKHLESKYGDVNNHAELIGVLSDLQTIHDFSDPEDWDRKFRDLADKH